MRKHNLIILIAVAIILCLATLSNGDVDKSNLVKRAQDSPYRPYGLYNYKDKKHKKKKHKQKQEHHDKRHFKSEIIKKRGDTSNDPDPPLGEVSVKQDEHALLKKRQVPPVSTGHVDSTKINPGKTSNP